MGPMQEVCLAHLVVRECDWSDIEGEEYGQKELREGPYI